MSVLSEFAAEMKRRKVRLHGAVLLTGGRVVDQVYNSPYNKDTKTRMYSTTKSVAAIAIGKLVGEGKLSLDDRVVDIFSDRFDMTGVHPFIKEQTVRQMLTMTTSHSEPTYSEMSRNWLESYFRAQPTHPAGMLWHYDSSGSYVLGAITKQLTGLDFVEYLRPELDEIGVSEGVYCLKGPDGEAWASSGLIATTEDLARIAYLMLKGGRCGDKQLIDEDFARDAISPLVRNDGRGIASRFDCGYGYQIWSHPGGAFAFRGLGGQIAIGYPGRDLVFCCTCDASINHNAYDDAFELVERIILPAFPVIDAAAQERLCRKPFVGRLPEWARDKVYRLADNPMGIGAVRFSEQGGRLRFSYKRDAEERHIDFSTECETEIIFPESYWGLTLFEKSNDAFYRCSTVAEWLEPRVLMVRVFAEDIYVGNLTMCFSFSPDGRIAIKMDKNAQFFFSDFVGVAYGSCID